MKKNGNKEFEVWKDGDLVALIAGTTQQIARAQAALNLGCAVEDLKLAIAKPGKVYTSKRPGNPYRW